MNPIVSVGSPHQSVDIDVSEDLSETKVVLEPAEEVGHVFDGLWVPARDGLLISTRQWRVIEGNLRFVCGGRCLIGPGNPYWWLILIVHTMASGGCCIVFDILPIQSSLTAKMILVILTVLSMLATTLSIFRVACSDPGYVMRPEVEQRINNLVEYLADKSPTSEVTLQVDIDGRKVDLPFCHICCHYRYPQVEHCPKCDCCISRLDHHNGTFGICIGKRNVGAFILFLFLSLVNFQIVQTIACFNIAARISVEGWTFSTFFASPTLYVLLLSVIHPPYGPVKFAWVLLKQLRNLMQNRTSLESRQRCTGVPENNVVCCKKKFEVFCKNFGRLVLCPHILSQLKLRSIVVLRASRKGTKRLKRNWSRHIYPMDNESEEESSLFSPPSEGRKSRLRHTLLRRSHDNMQVPINAKINNAAVGVPSVAPGFHRWTIVTPPPINVKRLRQRHLKRRNR